MSYFGLTNAEIVYLYFKNKERLKEYNKILTEKSVELELSLGLGSIVMLKDLTDEQIEMIREHKQYQIIKDIDEKLSEVVDLIYDTDPDFVNEIEESTKLTIDDLS